MRKSTLVLFAVVVAIAASCQSSQPAPRANVFLGEIRMFTESMGWGTAFDGSANAEVLLLTQDGGHHWRNVTPPGGWPNWAPPDFLDARRAWLLVANGADAAVWRTSDSGTHWQKTTITDRNFHGMGSYGLGHVAFIDRSHGWLWLAYGSEPGTLYRTDDGGASWVVVSVADSRLAGGSPIPWQGTKEGFAFVDTKTGWLTVTTYLPWPLLDVTHDGGATWTPVSYPDVAEVPHLPGRGVSGPVFESRDVGYFVVGAEQSILYRTTDAGVTWTPSLIPTCCDAKFLDSNTGWAVGYDYPDQTRSVQNLDQDLWRTDDGGTHWRVVHEALNAQSSYEVRNYFQTRIVSFDFPSQSVGYMVRTSGPNVLYAEIPSPSPPSGTNRLLRTIDGGASWTDVPYEVQL